MPLSDQDRALRAQGITATDVAALSGEHPFKDARDVYREKLAPLESSRLDDDLRVQLGHAAEPLLMARLASERCLVMRPARSECHPHMPWVIATPDRDVVIEGREERSCSSCGGGLGRESCGLCLGSGRSALVRTAVAEAKLVLGSDFAPSGKRVIDHWRDADGAWVVPSYVEIQVQWQMLARRVRTGYVAAMVGGEFRSWRLERSDDVTAPLMAMAESFYTRHVLARVPPQVDGSERAGAMLRQVFRRPRAELLPMTSEVREIAWQYTEASRAVQEAKLRKAALQNALCLRIAEATGFQGEAGEKVTWSPRAGNVSHKDAFQAVVDAARDRGVTLDTEAILEASRGAPTRVFGVTLPKADEGDEAPVSGERAA